MGEHEGNLSSNAIIRGIWLLNKIPLCQDYPRHIIKFQSTTTNCIFQHFFFKYKKILILN